MMFDVIITYDYGNPPIPRGYECTSDGSRPKCNHRVVGQVNTQSEGLAIGKDIFEQEIAALSWLIHDPVLLALDSEKEAADNRVYRWFDDIKEEYDDKLRTIRNEYNEKARIRQEELMRARGLKSE